MTRYAFLALLAATTIGGAALAQTTSANRKVVMERACKDGSAVVLSVAGDFATLEEFSRPRADGTQSGYETAYDLKNIEEAKKHFNAVATCPNG